MIELPIVGAMLEAVGTVLEKKTLKIKGVSIKNYTVLSFLAIVVVMLPLIYFLWDVKSEAYLPWNLFLLGCVVIISVVANLLIFYSLKRENISEFEPLWLMQPLFTILLAFTFYSKERNWTIVGLALIASISLIAAHIKKHHISFNKYALATLGGSFLFALELVISDSILAYYSSFSFYFVRCLLVFVISLLIFRPKIKGYGKKAVWLTVLVGIIWVAYRVILYQGYITFGVVFTTMLFILSPVFLLGIAIVFLHEKPTIRQIVSTIIILACVALAIVLNG